MQPIHSGDEAWEKLKTNFSLGVSCNFFTLAGMAAVWIFLAKTGWVNGFWHQIFLAFCFIPVFMGDAINAYVLGRIRLESSMGWEDVQITGEGKRQVVRWYFFFRALSLASAFTLVGLLISGFSPDPGSWQFLKPLFLTLFAICFLRGQIFIFGSILPLNPKLGGRKFLKLFFFMAAVGGWLFWLFHREPTEFSVWAIVLNGILYFLFFAFLHPLPSKFSIFRMSAGGKPCLRKIEPIGEEGVSFLKDLEMLEELKSWEKLGFRKPLESMRMPLLELPLFEAIGKGFLHDDSHFLLLILKSEVKNRIHRTLISWVGRKTYFSTDFEAPQVCFPDEFDYYAFTEKVEPETFFSKHRERLSGAPELIPEPVFSKLDGLLEKMQDYLRRGIKPKVMDEMKVENT